MSSVSNVSNKAGDGLSAQALQDLSKNLDSMVETRQVVQESRLVK